MNLALDFIYAVGSVVCHQLPERSFDLHGAQLPVCARCTGLYLSGAAGVLGWFGWKLTRAWRAAPVPPRAAIRVVLIAALPTVITVATGIVGIWDGSNAARAVLAVPLGLSAGVVVASVLTTDLR